MRCGAPDFMMMRRGVPFGFAEAKDVDKNLDSADYTEQFTRYCNSLNNLIITNYLEFRFFRDGEEVARVRPARLENGKIVGNPDEYERFSLLTDAFAGGRYQAGFAGKRRFIREQNFARTISGVSKGLDFQSVNR